MTETDLLARIEEQAAELYELKSRNARLQSIVDAMPAKLKIVELDVYRRMSRASVNCGAHSGCWLACQLLKERKI